MEVIVAQRKIQSLCRNAKRVVIVAHRKPDADSIGSAVAMLHYARQLGVIANGFCVDPIPDACRFLRGWELFSSDARLFETADVVITCDAGDLEFAGIAALVAPRRAQMAIINIDHHASNTRFGDCNLVDITACATAEVVYRFFQSCGVVVDRWMAAALLSGIVFDTTYFLNAGTNVTGIMAAADLVARGANLSDLGVRLMESRPLGAVRLWGRALERLKYHDGLQVASSAIFRSDFELAGIDEEQVEGITNFLAAACQSPVIALFTELPSGVVKGSLRSTANADVAKIAVALGGGGHVKAAGFRVKGTIKETENAWIVAR